MGAGRNNGVVVVACGLAIWLVSQVTPAFAACPTTTTGPGTNSACTSVAVLSSDPTDFQVAVIAALGVLVFLALVQVIRGFGK